MCSKFGNPVQKSEPCQKIGHVPLKLKSAKIVKELLVLKLFQLSNGDFFSKHAYITYGSYKLCVKCAVLDFQTYGRVSYMGNATLSNPLKEAAKKVINGH